MRRFIALPAALLLASCDPPAAADSEAPTPRGPEPEYTAPEPPFRRLTYSQYVHSVEAVFGTGLVLPTELEPDARVSGLYAVGAGVTTVSSLGVERYESAAFDIAEQVMADPDRSAILRVCEPSGFDDEVCAGLSLLPAAEGLWRRPLTQVEAGKLATIATTAATTLGDWDAGLSYGLAAVLQSPYFLFRPEFGEEDPDRPGELRATAWELAGRLSYFLWDSAPDAALRAAAADGTLHDEEVLAAQVERMLQDPKAEDGLRAFLSDMLELDELSELTKDPTIYTYMSADLGASAREQTLLDAERLVFTEDADFRTFLTGRETHLDRTLSTLYDVPAPSREGFGLTTLSSDLGRVGFLGQASFLALQSHATSTSATKRGEFIREVLLCQEIPAPPAGLNTSIPEVSEDRPTMRDRVDAHLEDPSCASCHRLMDPLGLGLENFDGLARWRTTENDVEIDAHGDLDGNEFTDAVGLANAVAGSSTFTSCLSRTMFAFANGRLPEGEEELLHDWHTEGLELEGVRLRWLMADIATGSAFRRVGVAE